MTIGAISLYVSNMDIMVKFYNEYMDMGIEWNGGPFCGVEMKNGVYFNLCTRSNPIDVIFPGGLKDTHQMTFNMSNMDEVNRKYAQLINGGAKHVNGPVSQPYGLYEAVVADPEGNFIEFVCDLKWET